MNWLALTIALVPTLVWSTAATFVRNRPLSCRWLMVAAALGFAIGFPAWWTQSVLAPWLTSSDRWVSDFLNSFISAATVEELFKFLCFIGVLLVWSRTTAIRKPRNIVAIALAVGIGFMTLENFLAVWNAAHPMLRGRDRLMSIFAGHPAFQIMMGYFFAIAVVTRKKFWFVIAIALPIFIHGLIDFAEQSFQDEPIRNSTEDTVLYYLWAGSIIATAVMAGYYLYRTIWHLEKSEIGSSSLTKT